MTVPTNNEEREALIELFRKTRCIATPRLERGYCCPVPEEAERMTDAVLAHLAARRLPVSGDNAEWRDSEFKKFMSRGLRSTNEGTVLWHRQREAFNAAWVLASQPREARGMQGDTPPEADATADEAFELGRVAGYDEAMREAAPFDPHMGVEHESYCHLQHGLGGKCNCTPHPVQVEVTEAAFDRFVQSFNGDEAGDIDDVGALDGATGWAMRGGNDVRAVFEKAIAALGGGDHAE